MADPSSSCNARKHLLLAAARDRADQSEINLTCTLFKFLTYILQDLFSTERENFGTKIVDDHTCTDIVEASLSKYLLDYTTEQLKEHKRLWDIVTRDKEGNDKDHCFSYWCRRVASHSKGISTATEHAPVEAEETQKSAYYRSLVEDMLAKELTTKQKNDEKYKLEKDKKISSPQRSWVTTMLRKNLGDVRVCYYILNHGVPVILNVPLLFTKIVTKHALAQNRTLLQGMLDQFVVWHRSLLQYIVRHKADPNMATALKLSDLNESVWRETRQRLKNKAKLQLKHGARLSAQKNAGKRMWNEMSATEQQLIEDYETEWSIKLYEALLVKKPRIR